MVCFAILSDLNKDNDEDPNNQLSPQPPFPLQQGYPEGYPPQQQPQYYPPQQGYPPQQSPFPPQQGYPQQPNQTPNTTDRKK